MPGAGIVRTAWVTTAVFAVTAFGDRAGAEVFELPATVVGVGLFGAGIVVWIVAFVRAVNRSRYEEITLTGLFFLQGSAPRVIQMHLLGALAASIAVAAVTAVEDPFAVLQPVFPLALAGLWGSRFGNFPPRRQ
jgi:hypothetical protein